MRAVIFVNGERAPSWDWQAILRPDDLLIAADAGAKWLLEVGRAPDVIVGDFDSMPLWEYPPDLLKQSRLVKHPTDKDATDLELALHLACQHAVDEILLFGLLGGRWDHSLANVLLLAQPDFGQVSIRALQPGQTLLVLRGGQSACLAGSPGDLLTLLPLGSTASGVQLSGTRWQLQNETLPLGTTRGVSNQFSAHKISISLKSGVLLCIHLQQYEYLSIECSPE